MLRFEDCRNDKEFKLETLSYEEIFDAFKDIVNEVKKKNCDGTFKFWPVELRNERCESRMVFGEDKNLYPKIRFDMGTYVLIVSTFEVKLLVIEYGIDEIKSEELDNALVKLMCEHFPNSDYLAKREKYFKDVELMKRTLWNNLFL